MDHPTMFFNQDNKTKIAPGSFSCFLELLWQKKNFSWKSLIVITVVISLHYKETNKTVLVILLLLKSSWKIKLGEFKNNQKYFAE